VLFSTWGIVLGLTLVGWRLAALVGLELAFGLVWSTQGLRPLRRWRFWMLIITAVGAAPLLSGVLAFADGDVAADWVWTSTAFGAALGTGLTMAGRALALTLSFSLGLSVLSLSDLLTIFGRLRLRGLGFALGVAMNLLSTLQEMATVTFQTIKLRAGLRRPLVAVHLFLVTLLSNTMRYGDQIVNGASVRAFDPNSDRHSPPGPDGLLRRADLGLFLALAVCSILLLIGHA
jgi:energy-coupling factor transporter transmembrane protein EcfT